MKFGIREICDVVLRAKANDTKVGNKVFKEHAPVIYFDSLKTSSMEGQATTVYAQGGRGNSRLIAWEGERTVTFTMEDALISEMGLAVLTGAGLIDAGKGADAITVHTTTRKAFNGQTANSFSIDEVISTVGPIYAIELDAKDNVLGTYDSVDNTTLKATPLTEKTGTQIAYTPKNEATKVVLFDFYVLKEAGLTQIEITPDKFGGNYYLEASTLFRGTDGVDHPAEFVIPNCKVQSNFTFSMASSGDPSTFTFTMDAFPDYTKFDQTKKVLFAIQIISDESAPIADEV